MPRVPALTVSDPGPVQSRSEIRSASQPSLTAAGRPWTAAFGFALLLVLYTRISDNIKPDGSPISLTQLVVGAALAWLLARRLVGPQTPLRGDPVLVGMLAYCAAMALSGLAMLTRTEA